MYLLLLNDFFGPPNANSRFHPDSTIVKPSSSHFKVKFLLQNFEDLFIYLFIFIDVFDSVFSSSAEHFHFIKQFWGVLHFLVCSIKTLKRREDRENGHLPISSKLFSQMFYIWNYLRKCSCFETRFSKNQVLI